MSSDSISNLIVSLQNAAAANRDRVVLPYSKHLEAITEVLTKHGFVHSTEKKGKKIIKELVVTLAQEKGIAKVRGVKRISKPSRRVYIGASDIKPVKSGVGISVLSTTEGVMTGRDARAKKLGGELLFELW